MITDCTDTIANPTYSSAVFVEETAKCSLAHGSTNLAKVELKKQRTQYILQWIYYSTFRTDSNLALKRTIL